MFVGSQAIGNAYVGSHQLVAAYVGEHLVWSREARRFVLRSGLYALSGSDMEGSTEYRLETGVYNFTGSALDGLFYEALSRGDYVLSGSAIAGTPSADMDSGSYTLIGSDLDGAIKGTLGTGSYVLSGSSILVEYQVELGTGNFSLTGFSMAGAYDVNFAHGSYALTGFAMTGSVVATGTQPSWAHVFGSGNRTSVNVVTITSDFSLGVGQALNNLVDGAYTANGTDSMFFAGLQSGKHVDIDFGAGNAPIVTGLAWLEDRNTTHGTARIRGSNDLSSFTDLKTGWTFGGGSGNISVASWANTVAYRYIRIEQTAGNNSSSPWNTEVMLRIGNAPAITLDSFTYGNRTSILTVSTTAALGAGTIAKLFDGLYGANSSEGCWFTNAQTLRELEWDRGSGNGRKVKNLFWIQSTAATHGTWVYEGWNGSTWVQEGSSFTLGGNTMNIYAINSSTSYEKQRIRQTGGTTSSGPWLLELEEDYV